MTSTLKVSLTTLAAAQAGVPAWVVYLAIGWSLVSWWLHTDLYLANGDDLSGLLAIEYGFHVSLYVTALVIAWFFLATPRQAGRVARGAGQHA